MRAAPPEQDHGYDTALDDPPCDTIEPGDLLDDPRTDAEALWPVPAAVVQPGGGPHDRRRPDRQRLGAPGVRGTVHGNRRAGADQHTARSGEHRRRAHPSRKSAGHRGTDVANFWFEVEPIPNPKDAIENTLNHATCHDLIPLATAQTAITHH